LAAWIDEVAHGREHPTQRGRTVHDCLQQERKRLLNAVGRAVRAS
jgi:hypothetical protein